MGYCMTPGTADDRINLLHISALRVIGANKFALTHSSRDFQVKDNAANADACHQEK
jgi:hypothetical protein